MHSCVFLFLLLRTSTSTMPGKVHSLAPGEEAGVCSHPILSALARRGKTQDMETEEVEAISGKDEVQGTKREKVITTAISPLPSRLP